MNQSPSPVGTSAICGYCGAYTPVGPDLRCAQCGGGIRVLEPLAVECGWCGASNRRDQTDTCRSCGGHCRHCRAATSEQINGRNPWRIDYELDLPTGKASGWAQAWDPSHVGDVLWIVYLPESPDHNTIWPPIH